MPLIKHAEDAGKEAVTVAPRRQVGCAQNSLIFPDHQDLISFDIREQLFGPAGP
jgi:hypothetical protein